MAFLVSTLPSPLSMMTFMSYHSCERHFSEMCAMCLRIILVILIFFIFAIASSYAMANLSLFSDPVNYQSNQYPSFPVNRFLSTFAIPKMLSCSCLRGMGTPNFYKLPVPKCDEVFQGPCPSQFIHEALMLHANLILTDHLDDPLISC